MTGGGKSYNIDVDLQSTLYHNYEYVGSPQSSCSCVIPKMGCDVGCLFSLAMYNTFNEKVVFLLLWSWGNKSDQWVSYESSQLYGVEGSGINVSFTIIGAPMGSFEAGCVFISQCFQLPLGLLYMVNYRKWTACHLDPFHGALGYLEIAGNLQIKISDKTRVNYHTTEERLLAKTTAHYDFYKDRQCLDVYGCSYTDCMVGIIDKLMLDADMVH